VLLVNDFFLSFMNDGDVFLMNVFLIDNRLDVFNDNWFVDLVDVIRVNFLDNVLVMLMDYLSVGVLDNGLFHDSLDNGCFLSTKHFLLLNTGLHNWSFFMSDHSSSFHS